MKIPKLFHDKPTETDEDYEIFLKVVSGDSTAYKILFEKGWEGEVLECLTILYC